MSESITNKILKKFCEFFSCARSSISTPYDGKETQGGLASYWQVMIYKNQSEESKGLIFIKTSTKLDTTALNPIVKMNMESIS